MKVSDAEFESYVKSSLSIADVCRRLGIRPIGGNYKTVNARIKRLELNTKHFLGQGRNKGRKFNGRGKPLKEILVENSTYTSSNGLRQRLIKEGIKKHQCEQCQQETWNDQPIPLELDHINGVNTDHRLENLRILCPNCHAQTKYYRGRNKTSARSEKNEVEACKFGETLTLEGDGNPERSPTGERVETLHRQPKSCNHCGKEYFGRNKQFCSYECKRKAYDTKPKVPQILNAFAEYKNYCQVAKFFGVSDNAVRKWVKYYGIQDMVKRKSSAQTE